MAKAKKNLQLISAEASENRPKNAQQTFAAAETGVHEKRALYRALQRRGELKEQGELLTKVHLVNKLNFTNFQNGTVLINMTHTKYDRTIILHAKPQPCNGDQLDCFWIEDPGISHKLKSYRFESFYVTDGKTLLMVEPELLDLNQHGISFKLPDACFEVGSRSMARHSAQGVSVQLIQNSSVFQGVLLDFNAVSLRIELKTAESQTFRWINPESVVSIILSDGPETIYSGDCKIIRQTWGQKTRKYVLESLKQEIQRFQHKEFRSDRQEVNPSPDIYFIHPLTKKMVSLKVVDISGSGFSVEEDVINAMLLPGMIIPAVRLCFASSTTINCRAQVVYRKICDAGKNGLWVKCGLVILDMALEDNVRLMSLLQQADHKYSYICNDVDLDELWDFFFETGFIYPEKYAYIENNKAHIKETYKKLYTQNPRIARHFIFQEKGRIMGHMAMVRFFENGWLIHHHAARKSALNKAGLIVLKQIGRFINDSYRLNSTHLDYVVIYYRPSNKFPSRVFGGAAKNIKNPKFCSFDPFAYLNIDNVSEHELKLTEPWRLTQTRSEDLLDLDSFYESESGGLMLKALDLEPEMKGRDELSAEYQRLGFKKERHLLSLRKEDQLKAVILVNISDIGLNLSNLTNSVKVMVLDSDALSRDIFLRMLSSLAEKLKIANLTVMLYPVTYADDQFIPYEKVYNLWVMSIQHIDYYFRYLERLMRFI
jgi:hypothetical protein